MRRIMHRECNRSTLSRLLWSVGGFACVSIGSAALGWQDNTAALKPALVVEALPSAAEAAEPAPAVRAAPVATVAPQTVVSAPTPKANPAPPPQGSADSGESSRAALPWPWSLGTNRQSNVNMRRPTPIRSAGSKATGNYGRLRPSDTRREEPPTATPAPPPVAPRVEVQSQPTPARREPILAERSSPNETRPVPTPAKPTPVAVKTAPIVKPVEVAPATRQPTPAKVAERATPAPATVAEPVVKDVPRAALSTSRKLAPLNVKAISDVRPAGFQEVLPGQCKVSDVVQQLGEPEDTLREGDTTVMTYQVGPFPKLEVILAGDVVDTIVIHLAEPVDQAAVLEELGLAEFLPVAITDETGHVLGVAIPERGVALSYTDDSNEKFVGQVVLATVTAEPFVLRATASRGDYEQMLADADYALTLDPQAADAHAVRARVLSALGRISEARTAIEAAIKLNDGAPDYRILYAELLSAGGDFENATTMVKTMAETPGIAPAFAAAAELAWGNLLAHGPERDYPAAVTHHTKAIKLATPLAQSENAAERRVALQLLIDANLAVARDVGLGNYKRQSEVVPKWLNKAQALQQLAVQDGVDEALELQVASKSLAALAGMSEPLDPSEYVEKALSVGQELIAATDDPLHKQQLEWLLGVSLLDAVQIEHARGEFDVAMQYANNALTLLGDNVSSREATLLRDHTMGRMYFSLGALYAVGRNDHTEAVHYYLQAIPLLDQPLPPELLDDRGRHGERMVSMGVSFWQNGNKPQAIELTLKGAKIVQDAVDANQLDKASLAVPYGNLAAMYRQLGNSNEAEKYGELAKRIEPVKTSRR